MTDRRLRLLLVVLALAILAFHYAYKEPPDKKRVQDISRYIAKGAYWVGKYPPDFTATLLDGSEFTLADQIGTKAIVLNFFATSCEPCVEEVPELKRFSEAHRREAFLLLGIDAGEKEDVARKFAADHALGYPVVADGEGTLMKLYGVESFPTSVFIGADGKIGLYEMGGIANADVTFAALLRENRKVLDAGRGIARADYLEALKNQRLEPPTAREPVEEQDEVVLDGRALRIAEGMSCVCGCDHTLLGCSCSTGTKMKKELKALAADDPRSDGEIMRQIDRKYCVGKKG